MISDFFSVKNTVFINYVYFCEDGCHFFCINLQVEIDIIDIIRLHTLFAYEQQT